MKVSVCGVASLGVDLVLQSPCVCVCACSQDLKLAIKQTLELLTPSSLRSSRTWNFIACSLFLVPLFPCLRYYQLWLLLFLLQLQYESRKRKRNSNNSRTQKTSKQKKPKKLKAKKNMSLSTLSDKKQFFQNSFVRESFPHNQTGFLDVHGSYYMATIYIHCLISFFSI